jgi:hypothetical protein
LSINRVRDWIKIGRDIVIVGVGAFMLIFETTRVATPNDLIVGAGLVLLGVPPILRLDSWVRGEDPPPSSGSSEPPTGGPS